MARKLSAALQTALAGTLLPAVQVLVPGFTVRELPLDLTNVNNVKYRPDGTLDLDGETVQGLDIQPGDRVLIPRGVAHVLWFLEDAVLAFGVSSYWRAELDVVGCRWDDPALGLEIPEGAKSLSQRDTESGSYEEMVESYESLRARYAAQAVEV